MTGIVWNNAYNIGIPEIDSQHKELIGIINDLTQAHLNSLGQIAVAGILSRLVDYANYHFSIEEQMQTEYKYPHLGKNKTEHKEFIGKLDELKKDVDNNNLLLLIKTMDFLKDWMITHILGTDKEFSEYLRRIEIQ
jgi:hemerythrin